MQVKKVSTVANFCEVLCFVCEYRDTGKHQSSTHVSTFPSSPGKLIRGWWPPTALNLWTMWHGEKKKDVSNKESDWWLLTVRSSSSWPCSLSVPWRLRGGGLGHRGRGRQRLQTGLHLLQDEGRGAGHRLRQLVLQGFRWDGVLPGKYYQDMWRGPTLEGVSSA